METRTIYDPDTAAIKQSVSASPNQIKRQTEGQAWFAGTYSGRNYYAPDGKPTPRPEFGTEPGTARLAVDQETTLAPLPTGTSVSIDGEHMTDMDDSGLLDVSFDSAGTHVVRLSLFPFKDKELTFEVEAPD